MKKNNAEMKKNIEMISKLYQNDDKPRILTDMFGEILWSTFDDSQKIEFAMLDYGFEIPRNDMTRIRIDEKECFAEPTVITLDGKELMLWRVMSESELIRYAGESDIYMASTYIVAGAKAVTEKLLNLSDAMHYGENEISEENDNMYEERKDCCYDLLRSFEQLGQMFSIIYRDEHNYSPINITKMLNTIADEANEIMSGHNIELYFESEKDDYTPNLYVRTSRHLFHVTLIGIIKNIFGKSQATCLKICISYNDDYVYITIPYDEGNAKDYYEALTDDYSVYCAKIYSDYIGGSFEDTVDGEGRIAKITLPRFFRKSFCAPIRGVYNETDFKYLTRAFLKDL